MIVSNLKIHLEHPHLYQNVTYLKQTFSPVYSYYLL
jgi:hypothetical protein